MSFDKKSVFTYVGCTTLGLLAEGGYPLLSLIASSINTVGLMMAVPSYCKISKSPILLICL